MRKRAKSEPHPLNNIVGVSFKTKVQGGGFSFPEFSVSKPCFFGSINWDEDEV